MIPKPGSTQESPGSSCLKKEGGKNIPNPTDYWVLVQSGFFGEV